LEQRHLADSLLFLVGLDQPEEVWDLGTGLGLPGVPLAIAMPDTRFVLVDRSVRRIELLRRVIRILDLENCETLPIQIDDLEGPLPNIVARASLSPSRMLSTARRLLEPGGRAAVGGSWLNCPRHPGWETIEIPPYVLDHTVWLLIMRGV
jgi:16S rRNA (guanine527-N7)-methyltransferase